MKTETYEANVSGAIFNFAAYLTTMDEAYTVGAKYDAARMAQEVSHFLSERGVSGRGANVWGWHDFAPRYTVGETTEYVQGGDPTKGRAMTEDDGEAGRLVVDLRNLVNKLRE